MANQPIYIKGKDLLLTLNGIAVGCDEQTDIEITAKMFDNGSKATVDASGNLFNAMIQVMNTVKFSGQGFTTLDKGESGGANLSSTYTLMQLMLNQTKCYATWVRNGHTYGCDVYISQIKETAKFDEISRYSYTLDGAGPIQTIPVS